MQAEQMRASPFIFSLLCPCMAVLQQHLLILQLCLSLEERLLQSMCFMGFCIQLTL